MPLCCEFADGEWRMKLEKRENARTRRARKIYLGKAGAQAVGRTVGVDTERIPDVAHLRCLPLSKKA